MSKSKRIVGPITTEYGTFQPGDEAIAVTVCAHQVHVARVTYVGYIERETYNWQKKEYTKAKYAQIRRPTRKFTIFVKGTDTKAEWPYSNDEVEGRWIDGTIVTTLNDNRLIPAVASADALMQAI